MQPIESKSSLPEPGTDRESRNLDFKQTVSPKSHVELAKDVAALANAFGGHIVIGAVEDKASGKLDRYEPLPETFAHEVATAYDKAVATRCFPKPLLDTKILDRDGGFVVVVNVWAYPGGAVGVRSDTQDAYLFPVRVGAQTTYLRPEALTMLMVPEVRRIAVLLGSIPANRRKSICACFRYRSERGITIGRTLLELLDVRPQQNVAVFQDTRTQSLFDSSKPPTSFRVHLPLDQIESAWSEQSGDWVILLHGRLEENEGVMTYAPRE